jgi:aspartate dehydrogenase
MESMDEIERFYVFDVLKDGIDRMVRDFEKAKAVESVESALEHVDLTIEAASQEAVRKYGPKVLKNGKDLMMMSVGALGDDSLRETLFSLAKKNRAKIYVPSGAIGGVDLVSSASMVNVDSVELETIKPPSGLKGAEYLKENGIDVDSITERTIVFEGGAREAVRAFPKNVNVSATLSLAGIGFDRTKVKVVVDPKASRNVHIVRVKGDFGMAEFRIENVPSPMNPRTSYLAAISAVATLKRIVGGIWIGI